MDHKQSRGPCTLGLLKKQTQRDDETSHTAITATIKSGEFCFNSVHQFENSWVFLFPLPGLLPSSQYKLYEIPQAFCRITDGERL